MKIARRLYLSKFWVMLAVYVAAMALPSALDYIGFVNSFGTFWSEVDSGESYSSAISSALNRVDPSGPDYLIWAFGGMLSALIYPFAVAATIVFLKSVIVNEGAHFRDCLQPVLRNWLTYAQFGLVWFMGFTLGRHALFALLTAIPQDDMLDVVAVFAFIVVAAFLYGIQYVGYVAALVAITIDEVDPVRAALAGLWLSARFSRGLFSIAWRTVLFFAAGLLCVAILYRLTQSASLVVGLAILGSLLLSSYLALSIALFFFDKLQREGYKRAPAWLRIR